MTEFVVGIDLGTTNSSIGVVRHGRPVLIPVDGDVLLPSVVGLAPDGRLLVGQAARNQYQLYPERTIRSVKRRMGEEVRLPLGDREYTPIELSAMILRRLKLAAEAALDGPVNRAVITVPAFFNDAQRTATRQAGEVAGFIVERILHEPTAASLCYAEQEAEPRERKVLVYDLGGGTFDVSIVRRQGEITEVLASHGDTHLGGDDFDAALLTRLRRLFEEKHGCSLEGDRRALARLSAAAEQTKIRLSSEAFVHVVEEQLAERNGVGLHLDTEVTRQEYEDLIRPWLTRTCDSVQIALRGAGLLARDLDEVILVGGSSRTPLVAELLHQQLGRAPRMDVDPDRAVALGATLQAARVAGEQTDRILVDASPFSFGTSHLGELHGALSPHCYSTIIRRNSPLPARQSQLFFTIMDGQDLIQVNIYQGEEEDARLNVPLGTFMVEGLDRKAREGSPILFELRLDLDGILQVEVTEKHTGLRKQVTIDQAFRKLTEEERLAAQRKILEAFEQWSGTSAPPPDWDADEDEEDEGPAAEDGIPGPAPAPSLTAGLHPPAELAPADRTHWATARSLIEKAERMAPHLSPVDRDEVLTLARTITELLEQRAMAEAARRSGELADVLFYLE